MRILVVGGGGREHTLVWKLAQSKKVAQVYAAPGNAGTAQLAKNLEISATDIDALTRAARENDIDLVVVLDRAGKSDSYRTLINNRREISKRLRDLKKKYPIDILVYTKDEWEELRTSGSSFIKKIEKGGITIL